MSQITKNQKILSRETTALLIIDVQEKVLAVMNNSKEISTNIIKLIKGFKVLNLPIFYTEQYPKGLGPTTAAIAKELKGLSAVQKMSFSCFGADDLFTRLKDNDISQVVIAGIETHVCVQQTVLDMLANDFQVNVCADAVLSRKVIDYNTALDRMRTHNAEITTTESVLFELLNVSGTDEFKLISKIVK